MTRDELRREREQLEARAERIYQLQMIVGVGTMLVILALIVGTLLAQVGRA